MAIANFVLPFVISLLFFFIQITEIFDWKKCKFFYDNILTILLVAIYTCQPNIFKSLMQLLDCREIDPGKFYLYYRMTEDCNSDSYKKWLYFFILPCFFFYGIFIPTVSYSYMWLRRKIIFDIKIIRKIGLFVLGLNEKNFLWLYFFIMV
jgi:hypothetical protein